jgi:hypothetical protein
MKIQAFTLGTHGGFREMAEMCQARWNRLNPYIPMTIMPNIDYGEGGHLGARLRMFEHADADTDWCVWVDSDIIPVRPMPPEWLDVDVEFVTIHRPRPFAEGHFYGDFDLCRRRHHFDMKEYFNAGFFAHRRSIAPKLRELSNSWHYHCKPYAAKEQMALNIFTQTGQCSYMMLPHENHHIYMHANAHGYQMNNPFIIHFCGNSDRLRDMRILSLMDDDEIVRDGLYRMSCDLHRFKGSVSVVMMATPEYRTMAEENAAAFQKLNEVRVNIVDTQNYQRAAYWHKLMAWRYAGNQYTDVVLVLDADVVPLRRISFAPLFTQECDLYVVPEPREVTERLHQIDYAPMGLQEGQLPKVYFNTGVFAMRRTVARTLETMVSADHEKYCKNFRTYDQGALVWYVERQLRNNQRIGREVFKLGFLPQDWNVTDQVGTSKDAAMFHCAGMSSIEHRTQICRQLRAAYLGGIDGRKA